MNPSGSLPPLPPTLSPLTRSAGMPRLCLTLAGLVDRLKQGYKTFTGGKFQEALEIFKGILVAISLTTVERRQQVCDGVCGGVCGGVCVMGCV